jgi:hypothetical protein
MYVNFFENTDDVKDSITFIQRLFQITIALALSESFKQFVADESKNNLLKPTDRHFYPERLPALGIFVCSLIPFFHGMSRYFYLNYLKAHHQLPDVYGYQLLFDGAAFLTESAVFFALSRALNLVRLNEFFILPHFSPSG